MEWWDLMKLKLNNGLHFQIVYNGTLPQPPMKSFFLKLSITYEKEISLFSFILLQR